MNMNYDWLNNTALSPDNKYQYNGKELNDDHALNWNDYGARWYDASVGRWWNVDPLKEKYYSYSTYNYTLNSPVNSIDPDGTYVSGVNGGGYRVSSSDAFVRSDTHNEKRQQSKDKRSVPIVYYTNVAGISSEKLVSIVNHAAQIFIKNGFKGLSFRQNSVENAKKITYTTDVFLALINQEFFEYDKIKHLPETLHPGHSTFEKNAHGVLVYDNNTKPYDTPWQSWVNLHYQKSHPNQNYATGYILAHEILHQLLAYASWHTSGQLYKGHSGGDYGYNLNYPGESVEIPKGPRKKLQKAETILPHHKQMLNDAFKQ